MNDDKVRQLLGDWAVLNAELSTLSIDDLKMLINYECSTKKRATYVKRMHQRYGILVNAEERHQLLNGGLL